jgi:hypothetical protein
MLMTRHPRARTASCFVPLRVEPACLFRGFAGLFAPVLARTDLILVGVLLCDTLRSFLVATAPCAVTTEAPQWPHRQRGRIPDQGQRPLSRHGDSDALFPAEVHSFLRGELNAKRFPRLSQPFTVIEPDRR